MRAGWVSLVVGVFVLGGKVLAYVLTGSAAIFSDATESVVNVAAALMLVGSLRVAALPADHNHPYGHGKIEFLSAGLEGAMILVAALMIVVQALRQLVSGAAPQQLTLGLALLVGMSVLNGALGLYLLRVGRRANSLALQADGRHVLADVWTSAGVVAGLLAVRATGVVALDPLLALAVALWILREGAVLVRESVRGLMDEADDALLEELSRALENERRAEWIDVHGLRAWRSGEALHADLHLVVPRYFDATRLHAVHEEVERRLLAPHQTRGGSGDIVVHFDPCGEMHCASCEMPACPVRKTNLRARPAITRARATRGDPEARHAPGVHHHRR